MITIKNKVSTDYIAAITVVLIQVLIVYFENNYSKFIFNFIEDTFGHRIFMIIIPLLSVITYSLYLGNSKLSFTVGFFSSVVPLIYYMLFVVGIDFYLAFPQTIVFNVVLGIFFGLIGMLFSIFKKNADIATRISMHAALLMSLLGIPAVFSGLGLYPGVSLVFWTVFNSAFILGLLLSYLILRDVKKAFIFTFSALIMTFLMIIITPLYDAIFSPYPPIEYLFFGIIIAIILGVILKVYTYYRAHKTPR